MRSQTFCKDEFMQRNPILVLCVMTVSAIAPGACGDDNTDDTTNNGTVSTSGSRNGQSSSGSAGSAARNTGTSTSGSATNASGTNSGTATDNGATTTGSGSSANTSTVRLNDAEIASVSMTANTGEIAQNMVAVTRAQSDKARGFAQDMVDMHTAALQREMALTQSMSVAPADNATAQMLKSNSDKMVAMLQAASDGDFDNLYLRGQLDAHQMVLSLIDSTLLPSAQAQPLRDELTMMRETVTMHLDRVRGLVDNNEQ
jgi:putative membrane protein